MPRITQTSANARATARGAAPAMRAEPRRGSRQKRSSARAGGSTSGSARRPCWPAPCGRCRPCACRRRPAGTARRSARWPGAGPSSSRGAARELDQPAHRQRAGAPGGHLDRHLVGGAADAPRADLERRRERLDRRLQRLHRVFVAALGEQRQRVVDDPLGGRLLAVEHHLVDDLLNELRAVDRVRLHRADLGGCASGHRAYFFFTPYCERAFLRSLTPAASSVPRTTL